MIFRHCESSEAISNSYYFDTVPKFYASPLTGSSSSFILPPAIALRALALANRL